LRGRFGLGDAMALATVMLWGASFAVIKSAYGEFTPLAFTAVRFVLVSATLITLMALLKQPLRIARPDLPRVAAVGLSHIALYQIFFSVGLKYTTASNSILIINTAPVMTAVLAWVTRAERLSWRQWVGLLLAATGVAVLVQASGHISSGHLKGDLITLLGAISYAVMPIVILPLYQRYSTLAVMTVATAIGSVVLIAVGAPELAAQSWAISPRAWMAMAYAAFGAGVVGYVFWYEAIRRIGPARIAAYSYLMPPFGVLVAVLLLREPVSAQHVLGGLVAIAGVILARWPAARAARTP
jgi:drug/metabolite transporter (DMT)-like permease